MDWSNLAGKFAEIGLPALGGIFGGPIGASVGGVFGKVIASTLGVEPTPQAVAQAIEERPNDTIRLTLAQVEAEASRVEQQFADIANARSQTVQLAAGGSAIAWGAPAMTGGAFVSFLFFTVAFFFVNNEIDDKIYALINAGYGAVLIWVGQSMNYWLGSSDGSKRNGDALRAVAAQVTTPSPTQVARDAIAAAKKR